MNELNGALGAADLPPGTAILAGTPAITPKASAQAAHDALPLRATLAYSAPALFGAAMAVVVAVYLSKFYVDVVLIPAGILALAMAIGRAFDAVVDPFIGHLSDHTRTRWGRRKPWIFAGTVGNACAYYALLTPPPTLSPAGVAWWYGAAFLLSFLCVAISHVPRQALGVELTFHAIERQRLYGMLAAFIAAGTLLGALTPTLLRGAGVLDPRLLMTRTAQFYVAGYLVTNLLFLLLLRERPEFVGRGESPFVPGVRRAWRNLPFRVMFSAQSLTAIPTAMPAVLLPFFVQYVLRLEGLKWTGIYLLSYFAGGFVFLPLWMALARKLGKRVVWLCLGFVSVTGLLGMFFVGPGDTWQMLALQVYVGSPFAAYFSLGGAMHADVIDYDELHTGMRREAQFSALWSIIPKFALIPGAAIPIAVLGTAGYVPSAPTQSEAVVFTLRVLFTLVPALFVGLGQALMWWYPMSEARHAAMREGVRLHAEGSDAVDPITGQILPPPRARAVDEATSWFLDYFTRSELTRLLTFGRSPLGSVLLKMTGFAALLIASLSLVMAKVTRYDVDPGPVPSLAIVVGGLAISGLLFHAMRIAPARRIGREPPPHALVRAHLAATEAMSRRVA